MLNGMIFYIIKVDNFYRNLPSNTKVDSLANKNILKFYICEFKEITVNIRRDIPEQDITQEWITVF